MKNIALIFAGGTGSRLSGATTPKQFLVLSGKPIIIHTLEYFQLSPGIDSICVVCLESRIPQLKQLVKRFDISKVNIIVPGGATGMDSIFNGLKAIRESERDTKDVLVLLHDGVRPLIDGETISACIESVVAHGCTATIAPAIETVIVHDGDGVVTDVLDRSSCSLARAPQGFWREAFYEAPLRAQADGKGDFIDSVSLMSHYGHKVFTVEGPVENIKVTTPTDYYAFKAFMEARDQSALWRGQHD